MKNFLRSGLVLAAVLLAGSAGCTVAPDDPHAKRPGPIDASHVCVDACDHVFVDGGWRLAGHRHGPQCGHALVNGRWVKAEPEPKPPEPR